MIKIPGNLNIVRGLSSVAGDVGGTGDYISMKYAHRVWVVFITKQGHAAKATLSISKAKDVAGTDAAAMTEVAKIYSALDCATSDVLTKRVDAASYELDAGLKDKIVVFEIDPSALGAFDTIAAVVGTSNALNITSVVYLVESRYGTDVQPSMIID